MNPYNPYLNCLRRAIELEAFGLILLLASAASRGADVIIATPLTGASTIAFAREPFAFEELGASSIRYQQVYSATEFLSDLPQGGFISSLVFRSDDQFGRAFMTGWSDAQMNMSVTSRDADQLSPVFADNIGANEVTVSGPGGLGLVSSGQNTVTFPMLLQTPYFYNPAQGNLLIEIRIFAPSGQPNDPFFRAGVLDAYNTSDTVSRVFAYDANATSGTTDTIGLTTFFHVTPIPEPSSTVLLLTASLGLFGLWWFRTHRSGAKN